MRSISAFGGRCPSYVFRAIDELGQVICSGHDFICNLREGIYDLGLYSDDPRTRQAPRVMRARLELTAASQAA